MPAPPPAPAPEPAVEAPPAPKNEIQNARDGSTLVRVPAGPFVMGDDAGEDDEKPAHRVDLDDFYLGKTEVTMGQYAKFLAWIRSSGHDHAFCHPNEPAGKDHRPALAEPWARAFSWESDAPPAGCENLPVVLVDWYDAYAYCRWAGGALPSEAQWEKAASFDPAGAKRRFPWGADYDPAHAQAADQVAGRPIPNAPAWDAWNLARQKEPPAQDPHARLAAVGSFPAGASALGILDLAGNAKEWCFDLYDGGFYAKKAGANPVSEAGDGSGKRVIRGGDWSCWAALLRTSYRDYAGPADRDSKVGFRLCLPAR